MIKWIAKWIAKHILTEIRLLLDKEEYWLVSFTGNMWSTNILYKDSEPTEGEIWDDINRILRDEKDLEGKVDWDDVLIAFRKMDVEAMQKHGVAFRVEKLE